MLSSDFHLDAKSISRLSSKGLCVDSLKNQIDEDIDLSLELWHAQGLEIVKRVGNFCFATKFIPIEEAEFCIVDIERNGSKTDEHQMIEIAARKRKDREAIGKFGSLVKCS